MFSPQAPAAHCYILDVCKTRNEMKQKKKKKRLSIMRLLERERESPLNLAKNSGCEFYSRDYRFEVKERPQARFSPSRCKDLGSE